MVIVEIMLRIGSPLFIRFLELMIVAPVLQRVWLGKIYEQ